VGCAFGKRVVAERQPTEILSIVAMFLTTHATVVVWSVVAVAGHRIPVVDIMLVGLAAALAAVIAVCNVIGSDGYSKLSEEDGSRRIPEFWEERRTRDGRKVYYYDHSTGQTHQKLPKPRGGATAPGRHSNVPGLQLAQSREDRKHREEMEEVQLARDESSKRHVDEMRAKDAEIQRQERDLKRQKEELDRKTAQSLQDVARQKQQSRAEIERAKQQLQQDKARQASQLQHQKRQLKQDKDQQAKLLAAQAQHARKAQAEGIAREKQRVEKERQKLLQDQKKQAEGLLDMDEEPATGTRLKIRYGKNWKDATYVRFDRSVFGANDHYVDFASGKANQKVQFKDKRRDKDWRVLADIEGWEWESTTGWRRYSDDICKELQSKHVVRGKAYFNKTKHVKAGGGGAEFVADFSTAPYEQVNLKNKSQRRKIRAVGSTPAVGLPPPYWGDPTHLANDEVLLERVDDDAALLGVIKRCFEPADSTDLGIGKDAAGWDKLGIPPDRRRVDVKRVWRLQNMGMWTKYQAKVTEEAEKLKKHVPPHRREPIKLRPEFAKATAKLPGFVTLNSDVNETYLLHGAPTCVVDKILLNGCDARYSGSNAGTMFGEGCYFAEDGCKVDQYTGVEPEEFDDGFVARDWLYPGGESEHPKGYGSGVFYVVLCRVALGASLTTKHGIQNGNTKCVDPKATADGQVFFNDRNKVLNEIPEASASGVAMPYHSLLAELGGSIHRHREFIHFDGAMVYPEILLAYKRKDANKMK
jgi:hypothetical protein